MKVTHLICKLHIGEELLAALNEKVLQIQNDLKVINTYNANKALENENFDFSNTT